MIDLQSDGFSIAHGYVVMSSPTVEIREIECSEYSICANIYSAAWNSGLVYAQRSIGVSEFVGEIEGELTLVAILDSRVRGYISIWQADWFVHHLYVDPLIHGAGLGSALLNHAQELAGSHPLSLKCQLANTGAMNFYRARGFSATGESGLDEFGRWVRLERASGLT